MRQCFDEIAVCLAEVLQFDGCLHRLPPQGIGRDTILLALCPTLGSVLKMSQGSDIIPIDRVYLSDLSVNPGLMLGLHLQQTLQEGQRALFADMVQIRPLRQV